MTLLALLFAMTPSLEAMACAFEGCDPACAERAAETTVANAADPATDNCVDSRCVCVAGHCNHAAVSVATAEAGVLVVHREAGPVIVAEQPVSKTQQTPERPPRA